MLFAGLGRPALIQPDEGRNAEVAREMNESGSWLIPTHNGVVYLDKPAFYFKAVGLSMAVFGENEFAARLPNAVLGFALLVMTHFFVRRETNSRCAALAVLITGTTPLFLAFARIVIMDMALAIFVCGAIFAGYIAESKDGPSRKRWYLLGAAFSGVATLVKGPIGFIIPTLVLLIFYRVAGHRGAWKRHLAPLNVLLFFAIVLPWFLGVIHKRPDFAYYGLIEESFHRYTTGDFRRNEPIWFFPAIIAGTFFAWSILLPESIVAAWRARKQWTRLDKLCIVWSVSLLIFFSLSHSKRAGYVLTVAVALGILTGRVFDLALASASERASRIVLRGTIALAVITAVVGLLLAAGLATPDKLIRALHLREEAFEQMRTSFQAMCAALLVTAIFAVVARWRCDARLVLAAFVLLPILLGTAGFSAFQETAEARSPRSLVKQMPSLPASTEVACLRFFSEGLPFYLKRTVTIITHDGTEVKSNYTLFLIRKRNEWPAQFVEFTDAEQWLASRTQPVYLLARKGEQAMLEELAASRATKVEQLTAGYWGALFPPLPGMQSNTVPDVSRGN
jgi:hypothetical protein